LPDTASACCNLPLVFSIPAEKSISIVSPKMTIRADEYFSPTGMKTTQ
jgi:hypothetical protein